jgi:hypothetical protein
LAHSNLRACVPLAHNNHVSESLSFAYRSKALAICGRVFMCSQGETDMELQRRRTAMAMLATIIAASCLVLDRAEARTRQRDVQQWQGWQTSSPNHWNAEAFWAWRAGLLP